METLDRNFFSALHEQFVKQADKVVLQTVDAAPGANKSYQYSYVDLDRESARISAYLKGLGIEVGDRVSVQVEKSPQALFLYLACLRAGFVFHPLNTAYQASELEYFLGNAEPSLVVCDVSKRDTIEPLAKASGVKHLLTLNADGTGSLINQSASVEPDFSIAERSGDDMAALLYSSGTTGVPKGIMLTHANLLSNAQSLVTAWGFTKGDQLLHALPIFHVHGLFVALGCVLLSGSSMRWMSAFKVNEVLETLPECTVMMGVPTYYTRLLDSESFDSDSCKNIRLFISGSAPLLEETFAAFEERTGHRILERYGMSETNMNTSNPLVGERKSGTVGPALPGVEVRIVDDNDQPLSDGDIGNLQVKGNNVFKGYWKMPEKTAEDFTQDGFFNTGDKGRIDEDGYVAIVGRAKDLVITGGLNVYPKEVELLIDDLPGVKESAVIGAPHPDFGEAVVAAVVEATKGTLDEQQIIENVKRSLAVFKVPKRVVFVDELPRNTMGKVQKNLLREDYKSLFIDA